MYTNAYQEQHLFPSFAVLCVLEDGSCGHHSFSGVSTDAFSGDNSLKSSWWCTPYKSQRMLSLVHFHFVVFQTGPAFVPSAMDFKADNSWD